MSDDDFVEDPDTELLAEAARGMFAMFVAMVAAGFSENQALKLVAMSLNTSGMADGMPGIGALPEEDE